MDLTAANSLLSDFNGQLIDTLKEVLVKGKNLSECVYSPRKIVEGDRPPLIAPIRNRENEFILYYPKNSTPYPHVLDGVKKECTILIGEIHEKISGCTLSQGRNFEIMPEQPYEPYTTDSICIAHVKLIQNA